MGSSRSQALALVSLVAIVGLSVIVAAGCRKTVAAEPEPFATPLPPIQLGARFAVLGDTQRNPSFLGLASNDEERRRVLLGVAEAQPELVVFTGDLVFDATAESWERFDTLTRPLRDRHVSGYAALGNHEYEGGRVAGENQFFARFPLMARRRWSELAFGPLRLVVLDSSEWELTPALWAEQRTWLETTLTADDANRDVRGVLVVAHHSPFTNSTVTTDEEHVTLAFVPAVLHARKTLGYLSGHVHSYERFVVDGKMFVVSGGGGGPRAALDLGPKRRHPDDLVKGPALRPFHFTIYTLTAAGITAEVRGLDAATFTTLDRFELPFAVPLIDPKGAPQ